MIRNQTLFYATAQDLSGVLSSLEAQKDLQYTLAGMFDSRELQTYFSYRDIPDLGRAFHRSAVANRQYLVSLKGTVLRIRDVPQNSGGVLFAVDLRLNEDGIAFSPGGRYRNDVMLYGMIGTLSPPSVASKNLYAFAAKAFRKDFKKVMEYFVGPDALDLMASGVRLTLDATTPPEFDLNRRRLSST
jgi:hypothetical protein